MKIAIKSDFTPDKTYEVSDLNHLMGCFTASGVIGMNDLKVIYSGGRAVISQGSCILPDKSILTVDSGGYAIPKEIQSGYIYIKNGEIMYGEAADGEGIFLLGQIAEGKAVDLRTRAYIYAGEGVK